MGDEEGDQPTDLMGIGLEAREQARRNVANWGDQTVPELALALTEELGEASEEIIPEDRPSRTMDFAGESWYYLKRASTAGESVRQLLEENFEADDGTPLHRSERPDVVSVRPDMDSEALRAELVDMMALLYQKEWALSGGSDE